MVSPLDNVRAQISSDLEALTPYVEDAVRYHEAVTDTVLAGQSGRRAFFHVPPFAGDIVAEASGFQVIDYRWELIVKFTLLGLTNLEIFARVATEGRDLMGKINTRDSWPTGARGVKADGWVLRPHDREEALELAIQMTARIEEPYA